MGWRDPGGAAPHKGVKGYGECTHENIFEVPLR